MNNYYEEDGDEYEIKETVFICCSDCFDRIKDRNIKAAETWLKTCILHLKNEGVFEVLDKLLPELRTLEMMGFITTTECFDDNIDAALVRVNGHQKTDTEKDFFCIGGHDAQT